MSFLDTPVGQVIYAVGILIVTAAIFYFGFDYLRTNATRAQGFDKLLVVLISIVWGVGGIWLFFYVINIFVELLPFHVQQMVQPYFFVLPGVGALFYFLALPTLRTLWLSFQDGGGTNFVGLDNYIQIFTEPFMLTAMRNNLLWIIFGATLSVSLGLVIATLADRSSFENIAKSLIFLPMAISFVGAGVIWDFIYEVRDANSPQIGLLNAVAQVFGIDPQPWTTQIWIQDMYEYLSITGGLDWLNNLFLIVIVVWLQTGFAMVLFSAALKGIPGELIEAAKVDGASELAIFFRIMIPYIWGTIITVSTTVIIFTLKIFDVVWVMTGGNFETAVIGTEFYRQNFILRNFGLGAAIAIVLLLAVTPVMAYNLSKLREQKGF